MRKYLIILLIALVNLVSGQDIKPTDTNFKNLRSPSFSYYTTDSSVWIYKGVAYGWTKLASERYLLYKVDSLSQYIGGTQSLEYVPFSDKGIMNISGGTGDTIPLVNSVHAGLMSPELLEQIGDFNFYAIIDSAYISTYGALYNRYAATDSRNIAKEGYRVPTSSDYETLFTELGGESVAGLALRVNDNNYWGIDEPDPFPGNNTSGFSAIGAGIRDPTISWVEKNYASYIWTIDDDELPDGKTMNLYFGTESAELYSDGLSIKTGASIRLIKNSTTLSDGQTGTYTGNDGKVYKTVCIGTQEWLAENLNETKYRNGDWITGYDNGVYTPISNSAWAALTTEAMCYYDDNESNASTFGISVIQVSTGDTLNLSVYVPYSVYNPAISNINDTLISHNIRLMELENAETGIYEETDPIYSADSINIVWFSDLDTLSFLREVDLSDYAQFSDLDTLSFLREVDLSDYPTFNLATGRIDSLTNRSVSVEFSNTFNETPASIINVFRWNQIVPGKYRKKDVRYYHTASSDITNEGFSLEIDENESLADVIIEYIAWNDDSTIVNPPPEEEPEEILIADWYVSPTGSDSNPGTIDEPFFQLEKAFNEAAAGDLIYVRGGQYNYSGYQEFRYKNGTAGNLIKIWNYPGETPIISPTVNYDYAANFDRGIYLRADYVHIKGLEVTGYNQVDGSHIPFSLRIDVGNNNIIERCNVHNNSMGITVFGDSSGNLLLNCDAHHNADPLTNFSGLTAWNNGDGIYIRSTNSESVNTIIGCRSWRNADDGFDFYNNNGTVIVKDSWAFENGYRYDTNDFAGGGQGFKIGASSTTGELNRYFHNCLSFRNARWGFTTNNHAGDIEMYNNTIWGNGNLLNEGWRGGITLLENKTYYIKNNISFGNSGTDFNLVGSDTHVTNNSWQGTNADADDFISINPALATTSRDANGDLPVIDLFRLVTGSDMINAGVDVGLPFNGLAPDLGAFEK